MSSKNTSSWNAVTEYKDYQESLDRLSAIANNNQVNKAMDGYQVYQDLKTIQEYNGDDRDERLDLVLAKLSLINSGYAMFGLLADKHGKKYGTKDIGAFINTSSMQFDVALYLY